MSGDNEIFLDYVRLRKERLERTRNSLKKNDIEAVLLFQEPNIRYVARGTGRALSERSLGFRYSLFPVNSSPTLFEFGMFYYHAKRNTPWLDVQPAVPFLAQGPPEAQQNQLRKMARQIKSQIKENGLSSEVLHIDVTDPRVVNALSSEGIKVSTGAAKALNEAREVKTRDEVEAIRTGTAISEAAFARALNGIRTGAVSENELRGSMMDEMYRRGMEMVPTAEVSSGPRIGESNITTTSDRLIRNKDLVIINTCSSSYSGYRICYYRTFSSGQPTMDEKDAYEDTREILYEGIRALKPGATTKDIVDKWPRAEEFGYPNEDAAFWLQWGHGIGLTIAEGPTFTHLWSDDYPEKLKAGMTLALETWLPTKDSNYRQSVRIEEMLHITESGCEILSRWPIDEISW